MDIPESALACADLKISRRIGAGNVQAGLMTVPRDSKAFAGPAEPISCEMGILATAGVNGP